ncbi:MAG: hypothetical protein ACE5I1_15020, partial [bacterium]
CHFNILGIRVKHSALFVSVAESSAFQSIKTKMLALNTNLAIISEHKPTHSTFRQEIVDVSAKEPIRFTIPDCDIRTMYLIQQE